MSNAQNVSISAPVVIGVGALIVITAAASLCIYNTSTEIHDITRSWKAQPIVSIYIPQKYEGGMCTGGYELWNPSDNLLTFVSRGPCGCTLNDFTYQSSNKSCTMAAEMTDECSSSSLLPAVYTSGWRQSAICVKRGGKPAGFYDHDGYHGRPHPNEHGHCPKHYKKCGSGSSQKQGAVCFPKDLDCPITNIRVVPKSQHLQASDGWERAGTFLESDMVLYVGRERFGELPIVNFTVALTEIDPKGRQVRGSCFKGVPQNIETSLEANPLELWSYTAALPPVCEVADPRWSFAELLSLEDYFLQSAEARVPECAAYKLFSLTDPRYNATTDPDYVNSGVPCGTAPLYSPCARDPTQPTDCVAGDSICDGVVHQNVCGEYARAVRSAFVDSTVNVGFLFAREIEWADSCTVSKASIFRYWTWLEGCFLGLSLGATLLILFPLGIPFITFGFVYVCKLFVVHRAAASDQCSDDFTSSLITSRLHLIPAAFGLSFTVMVVLCFLVLLWCIAAHKRRAAAAASVLPVMQAEIELGPAPGTTNRLPLPEAQAAFCSEQLPSPVTARAPVVAVTSKGPVSATSGGEDERGMYGVIPTEK